MLFNSFTFIVFFFIVFTLFWCLKNNLKLQNIMVLIASYVFYGWWDYRFLSLVFFSSFVDYIAGYQMLNASDRKRNFYMWISAVLNLGLLMYFKYLNFFIESFIDSMALIGVHPNVHTMNIILPVGISYYTFQSLSYTIDVYRRKLTPTKDFVEFMAFVSFFPQLVAGPIERASDLIKQFYVKKEFSYERAVDGLRLMLYGFFKKIVLADNIALRVDPIFNNPSAYSGLELVIGSMFFIMQLYCDLSGYADIARGLAKLFSFELAINFKFPFFSTSIPESWRKWHITLTTWFRDYLFLPLAKKNIQSTFWRIATTMFLFVVIGFWHGANLTFILFGFMIGLYFIPTHLSKENKSIKNVIQFLNKNVYIRPFAMIGNYMIFSLTSVIFRTRTITETGNYFKLIFTNEFWQVDDFILEMFWCSIAFNVFEWFMQHKDHAFEVSSWPALARRSAYVFVILLILLFGYFGEAPFYYFQF